jgi:hypothetical protein
MVGVKGYLLNEIRLKVLALVLAVMLWVSMNYLGELKMGFSVPLTFSSVGRGMMVREADTKNVMVLVNGPLSVLKNLKAGDIRVNLNLSRAGEGRQIFTIRKGDVVAPLGVKIEDVKPDYVVVELDKVVEKRLRAVVELDKRWVSVYKVASWYPLYVDAEGPKELLESRTTLETLPVSGAFRQQEEVRDVPFDTRALPGVRVTPETARVILKRIGRGPAP